MAIYEWKSDGIEALKETSFGAQGLKERQDLQRLLQDQIAVVDSNVMVLAEEFGRWDDSKRRIDLLCLDRDARLVVVELKRTEDGGHMELQALRYAAMVARMTFEQAVEAHRVWLEGKDSALDAEQAILRFLDWEEPDEERFGQDVRIVLVSGDFSKEVTTSVLWLNERGLDVRCVRMKPYVNDGKVLVDVQQVLPLPEAGDYLIQVQEKARKERQARESSRDYSRFDVTVDGQVNERMPKRGAMRLVIGSLCAKGVSPDEIAEALPWKGTRLWRCAPGELDAEEFSTQLAEAAAVGGPGWDAVRWFCDDEGLIRCQGKTWALTNQWGGKTQRALTDLFARWPNHGISVTSSAT
jgi:hypothetical protein